jgi:hypothetical protein
MLEYEVIYVGSRDGRLGGLSVIATRKDSVVGG